MTTTTSRPGGIEMTSIRKSFGSHPALRGASMTLRPGTVHALVGENGAGKSTLGKVCGGLVTPDSGRLVVNGEEVTLRGPRDALAHGIAMIAQEIALVPAMTVQENVFLGIRSAAEVARGPRQLAARYDALREKFGFTIPGNKPVEELRIAERQGVEILRALSRNAHTIVMDEPTATQDKDQTEVLFRTIRMLRERGTSFIFVSHFLHEVLDISDDITVMRDGHTVMTGARAEFDRTKLTEAMLGQTMSTMYPARGSVSEDAPVVVDVKSLSSPSGLRDVNLTIRAGEILGLAGIVGSGRSEIARCIFGLDPVASGTVTIGGRLLRPKSVRAAIRAGIGLVPESRKDEGLLLDRSAVENLALGNEDIVTRFGFIRPGFTAAWARELLERVDARGVRDGLPVRTLSGGNQQKILIARWAGRKPALLIVDEPTRGVDIGARANIYETLHRLASRGAAILLISSELEEVINVSHRVGVVRDGALVAEFDSSTVSDREILTAMLGDDSAQEGTPS